jgi:hypothetical protein
MVLSAIEWVKSNIEEVVQKVTKGRNDYCAVSLSGLEVMNLNHRTGN